MPPGTAYLMLSATDSIIEGGYYFLKSALPKSFVAGMREKAEGVRMAGRSQLYGLMMRDIPDTIHVASETILHGILKHYFLGISASFKWTKRVRNYHDEHEEMPRM
jgi:hypothetical protein